MEPVQESSKGKLISLGMRQIFSGTAQPAREMKSQDWPKPGFGRTQVAGIPLFPEISENLLGDLLKAGARPRFSIYRNTSRFWWDQYSHQPKSDVEIESARTVDAGVGELGQPVRFFKPF